MSSISSSSSAPAYSSNVSSNSGFSTLSSSSSTSVPIYLSNASSHSAFSTSSSTSLNSSSINDEGRFTKIAPVSTSDVSSNSQYSEFNGTPDSNSTSIKITSIATRTIKKQNSCCSVMFKIGVTVVLTAGVAAALITGSIGWIALSLLVSLIFYALKYAAIG